MNWWRELSIALCAVAFVHSGLGQNYQGRELVKATLLADASAIVPGKPFTAGLLLRMAPGWHTYWKFSGDAGLPTEIKWNLPPGWKVSEIQWPIPLKTNDPGDIQTYGYQDEILLMQELTPPAKIDVSPVKLSAEANWLVCEKICIPGGGTVELELPTSATADQKNTDLFARYRRLLPQKFPDSRTANASWSRAGSDLHLKLVSENLANYPTLDFYPLPQGNTVVGHPAIESRKANEVTFRIPIESPDKNLSGMPGLLVFSKFPNGNDRAAWELGAPAIAAAQATQPSRGIVTFLFFGFIGGFILNLMPCVLPVISLKIFGFIQQAGQSRQRIFRSGLAFTAGIFAWFLALAFLLIALKASGRDVTWGGFQFTNAYFVLGLSVIVLVFALNLFGVFEVSLPQSMTRGLLATSERKDNVGSFFQGVFATVLATPCTAPFLGTALGFAFTQSPIVILSMFVAVAAGMSAPYFLLSAQPAWLRFLPAPGPWMVHLKQFMGFLLLATLLFLLYVLGAQRGLDGAIWASCFLLIVAIVCWMKGAFIVPTAPVGKRTFALLLMLLLLLASGVYFIGDKFQSAKIDLAASNAPGDWQPFTPERLQSERDQGHAVFIDFTAAWCLTCKFNEKSVLENGAVRDAFQRHGVVRLKADWTNGDPVITKLLQQFGRPGVPLYVLYPGKSEEPIVFPELLTKSILLDKLETITPAVASQ
ncbi:MAG TPA: protein-disulfide reductase DsbD domain-containing protein [Chthoniobacterales bacterium]|jgi:thiol:disulfide interchange protein/DsbC/DsbD-like thiol-disulfide interchange protein|nr:protein-disulfide reductase DsbD domain-containing protein [Chthoniobacterales bacterium]